MNCFQKWPMREINTRCPWWWETDQFQAPSAREDGLCVDHPSSPLCLVLILSKYVLAQVHPRRPEGGPWASQGARLCAEDLSIELDSKSKAWNLIISRCSKYLGSELSPFSCGILLHMSWASKNIVHIQAMLGSKHFKLFSVCCII